MIAIARKRKFNPDDPVGDGFFAFLPLNKAGLFQLATNTLDTRNPDLTLLAGPNERPAGIYVWATYAPGPLAAGVALVLEQVETPNYAGVDLYSRPNTPAGFRFNENLGWKKGAKIGPIYAPHLYTFRRAPLTSPLYDSYRRDAGQRELAVTVARTFEDLMRVASLRARSISANRNVRMRRNSTATICPRRISSAMSATSLRDVCVSVTSPISPKSSASRFARNSVIRGFRSNWCAPESSYAK